MKPYVFHAQRAAGEKGEGFLDRFFEPGYLITASSRDEQRMEIDRHFVKRATGYRVAVEYKTDELAQRFQNVFIETVSVDSKGKAGWALTSAADFLIYYVLGLEIIYVVRFSDLRRKLPFWIPHYPAKSVPNEGYHTWGLPVPLTEFELIASEVYAAARRQNILAPSSSSCSRSNGWSTTPTSTPSSTGPSLRKPRSSSGAPTALQALVAAASPSPSSNAIKAPWWVPDGVSATAAFVVGAAGFSTFLRCLTCFPPLLRGCSALPFAHRRHHPRTSSETVSPSLDAVSGGARREALFAACMGISRS